MIQVQSEEVTVDTIEQRVPLSTKTCKANALRFISDRDQPFFSWLFSVVAKVRARKL